MLEFTGIENKGLIMSEDPDLERYQKRLDDLHNLSKEQRLDLASALIRRDPQQRMALGFELLKEKFPSAPSEMCQTAAFHAYCDLPDAMCELLAWLELNLSDLNHESVGAQSHVLYHLYNWLQVETLIPWGRQVIFDELKVVSECLKDDDIEGAKAIFGNIMELFEGHTNPPKIEP